MNPLVLYLSLMSLGMFMRSASARSDNAGEDSACFFTGIVVAAIAALVQGR